jgi:hypothetical protein
MTKKPAEIIILRRPYYPKLIMKDGVPQCPICDRVDGLVPKTRNDLRTAPPHRLDAPGTFEYHCQWCDQYSTLEMPEARWTELNGCDYIDYPGDADLEEIRKAVHEPGSLFHRRVAGILPPVDVDDPDSIIALEDDGRVVLVLGGATAPHESAEALFERLIARGMLEVIPDSNPPRYRYPNRAAGDRRIH